MRGRCESYVASGDEQPRRRHVRTGTVAEVVGPGPLVSVRMQAPMPPHSSRCLTQPRRRLRRSKRPLSSHPACAVCQLCGWLGMGGWCGLPFVACGVCDRGDRTSSEDPGGRLIDRSSRVREALDTHLPRNTPTIAGCDPSIQRSINQLRCMHCLAAAACLSPS